MGGLVGKSKRWRLIAKVTTGIREKQVPTTALPVKAASMKPEKPISIEVLLPTSLSPHKLNQAELLYVTTRTACAGSNPAGVTTILRNTKLRRKL